MRRALCLSMLTLWAAPVVAQTTAPSGPELVSIPAAPDLTPTPPAASAAAPQWLAEATTGYAKRDDGPSGAFAVTALSRQLGHMYLRGALTAYRSTVEQSDTALPSTYVVGSVGMGGNFHNWVFDTWASYGWQHYGVIEQHGVTRTSTSRDGSPYASVGFDAGRIFTLGHGFYTTSTLGVTYSHNRLLRPSPDPTHWPDYESNEPTWTGIAALRLDKALGREHQHYVGIAASWHITDNGLSVLIPPLDSSTGTFGTRRYADGWGEIAANGSFRLTTRLRLEASVARSIQALAGNATTVSGGLHVAF